jgi:hypothetical protein
VRVAAMCCFRQSGHQQLAPGAEGTGSAAGRQVHQQGCAGADGSASTIAHENCAPQREQVLIVNRRGRGRSYAPSVAELLGKYNRIAL